MIYTETKRVVPFFICMLLMISHPGFADDNAFKEARTLQRQGQFEEAINVYKSILSSNIEKDALSGNQLATYTDALVQLMNTFQSIGAPKECISALNEVFDASDILQTTCLRDFYSVMGYALSRTEDMKQAEETILKALSLPLHQATNERYFRDYAYAAAVFYSNPDYQKEVINWCREALAYAKSCKNTSGQQWVMSMLGSLYKRSGDLNGALQLFLQSIEESRSMKDDLGTLNSLNSLVDLFLYWDLPEYANRYASEAVAVDRHMKQRNPMVSAQTYINKGRALQQIGQTDSIDFYIEHARELCETLPYNSGMVDIDLIDSDTEGLLRVTRQGTAANRAKAYHSLAQDHIRNGQAKEAGLALDSLHDILNNNDIQAQILHIDYRPILNHYLQNGNLIKVRQYVDMMLTEQESFKKRGLNYNLVESIVDLQAGNRLRELKILQLKQANQRLWLTFCAIMTIISIAAFAALLFYQKKKHAKEIKIADRQLASLVEKLNRTNDEKERLAQEIKEFLTEKDNRQEFETLTPYILKESGEIKFRQCFELLYPLFLPRLREKVPSITRREEILSMLIALKQDNKSIAELLAIAPRSVLMNRHRFRQKIGMDSEYSLENFIEDLLKD